MPVLLNQLGIAKSEPENKTNRLAEPGSHYDIEITHVTCEGSRDGTLSVKGFTFIAT